MSQLIASILKPFWPIIAAAVAALLAFMGGKRQGEIKGRHKQAQRTVDAMKKAKEVRDEVRSTNTDDVHERLSEWQRD